jgi:dephospho-CoA kinase
MITLGLVGGVASGKTTVARHLQQLGAAVIEADKLGHEVLRMPAIRVAVGQRFGSEVIDSDGQVDRRKLAEIVFAPPPAGPAALEQLERLTHPEIGRLAEAELDRLRAAGGPMVVLDAPVLLEAGWDRLCDRIAFVDAPLEVRRGRAAARGWSEAEFAARERAQKSLAEKRRRADFVLDNSGTNEYTQQQVERLWHALVG